MTWTQFLLMRHELLLIAAALIILVAELNYGREQKKKIIRLSIWLFFVVVVAGFFPSGEGTLFGGMYVTGEVRLLMKNLLNVGVLLIFMQSANWLESEESNEGRVSEFYLLMLSSLIGVNYMISAGNFLMLHLGLELTTIPIAALAAYEQYKSKSAEAGIKMILSSAFSSGILLFGLSLIYGTTGSISFEIIREISGGNIVQVLGFIFFFAGIAFKISIVPFHLWTADVYEGSPTNITSYLSVVSKGASVFVLMIVLFTIFRPLEGVWKDVIYVTAIFTMTVGNLFAIRQQNLKRFLAFSSIAQAGFIFLGVVGGTMLGLASVIYFVLIYVFSNLAAFGVVSAVSVASGKENIKDYDGLYHTNPKLSLLMMLALFSLAGIPPVAGFFGKFFLFAAAAEQGYYILLIIAVFNAILSLYYYLLVVKAMFINKNDQPIKFFKSDFYSRVSFVACVAGIVLTGFASEIFDYMLRISTSL